MILIDDYFKQGLNRFQNSQSNHQYLLIQKSFKQCKLNEYMNIVIESQQLYRCQSCSSWTALFLLRVGDLLPCPYCFLTSGNTLLIDSLINFRNWSSCLKCDNRTALKYLEISFSIESATWTQILWSLERVQNILGFSMSMFIFGILFRVLQK